MDAGLLLPGVVVPYPCTSRLLVHEQRVEFLDSLSVLLGYHLSPGHCFPDRRRPDVLKIDRTGKAIFVGDAKNTESPGFSATKMRLARYLRWISTFCSGRDARGIFCLCFGETGQSFAWEKTIEELCIGERLHSHRQGLDYFGPGLIVAWTVLSNYSKETV